MSIRLLVVSEDRCSLPLAQLVVGAESVQFLETTWAAFVAAPGIPDANLCVLFPPLSVPTDDIVSMLRLRARRMPLFVIFDETIDPEALSSIGRVADDFVIWRRDREAECRERLGRLLAEDGTAQATRRLIASAALDRLIGHDAAFVAAIAKLPLLARANGTVLLTGETGTGKELCARAIHHLSPRRLRPFIPVDCAALPDQLVENELFGHARGAFTDAHREQSGLLALAEGGTLFLDEVDSLSPSAQAKLLRFLEDRTYRALGSARIVQADVRVVAATNSSLDALVEQKRFRGDLFFRLHVFHVHLPPLRERVSDIPLLARHFADRACDEAGIRRKRVLPSTIERLRRASWPGNARELFNVIQQAVVCFDSADLLPSQLAMADRAPEIREEVPARSFAEAKAEAVQNFERSYVTALLRKHGGNVTHSALEAQTDRRVFGRLLKKHRINRSTI